jgi:hypothetical protein
MVLAIRIREKQGEVQGFDQRPFIYHILLIPLINPIATILRNFTTQSKTVMTIEYCDIPPPYPNGDLFPFGTISEGVAASAPDQFFRGDAYWHI